MATIRLAGKASKVFNCIQFLFNLYGSITLKELEAKIG
jgi:hypothetical protein